MNFLIKIEEAINRLILILLTKLKELVPDFYYDFLSIAKQTPHLLKEKFQVLRPKLRILGLKFIGHVQQYTTLVRGYLMVVIMYLRSDEFKKADKIELILSPFKFAINFPIRSLTIVITFFAFIFASSVIYQNAEKIILGTNSLRKPASMEKAEEDVFVEFKSHKFEVKIQAAAATGGHGAAAAPTHSEYEIFLDLRIEAQNPEEKEYLEHMEEMLDDNLEALELPVSQLPLSVENQKQIEEYILKTLNPDFSHNNSTSPIKSVKIKQVLPSRPLYYRQAERMTAITDMNLQIFLEDTHRNRQVWIDFSVLASNRNVILYLKDHDVELKDHLTTNVEPVIPQLPIEEEGRLIIKDKMRTELNQFLEKNGIEGKILDIYIDYLMAS